MAIFIACSWNSGTPSVLPSTSANSCDGNSTGPRRAAAAGRDAPCRLESARADDRHLDDQVVEAARLQRGSIVICARLSTWNTPTESASHSMS